MERGENVKYLALQNLEYPADFSDGLHPNAAGFQKIGKAWADAITNIYVNPEGDQRIPVALHAKSNLDRRSVNIVFSKPISDISITNLQNFRGDQDLKVLSVSINEDKLIVTLTTTYQIPGIIYSITMDGI